MAMKMLQTNWTMKLWMDEEDRIGCYFRCPELPHLTVLEVMQEGVWQNVQHPLLGGKARVGQFKLYILAY